MTTCFLRPFSRWAMAAAAVLMLAPVARAQPSTATAQPGSNPPGVACIEQVCIGDELERLRGLAWDSLGEVAAITMPMAAAPAPLVALQSLYRADEAVWPLVAPYLLAERFDGNTLAVLDQVRAACGKHEVRGNFIAWGGEPTRVGIALRPGPQGVQRWQVVSITQAVPAAASEAQRSEITAKLHERYRDFNVTKLHNPQPGANTFFITATPEQFTYNLLMYRGLKEDAQLKRSTQCGGNGAPDAVEAVAPASRSTGTRAPTKGAKAKAAAPNAAKNKSAVKKSAPARSASSKSAPRPVPSKSAPRAAPAKKAPPKR